MGTDRCTRTTLVTRCCHGAFFGFGFVSTILTLTVMFWIAWCYFGLTILQISDSQRRALVNYSYVNAKSLPTPTTAAPSRSTAATTEETSINSISKSPTTASILRGSSRGESQVKVDKKKGTEVITNLAKGDFAERVRETPKNATKNSTVIPSKDAAEALGRETSKKKDVPYTSSGATAAILSGADIEESDDRVYARRVLPSGSENRAEEKSEASDRPIRRSPPDLENSSRLDISPTKVYATATTSESLKVENPAERPSREEARTRPRDYINREKSDPERPDDIQSSRRSDTEAVYREPDFDREYPKTYAISSDRGRFDDFDDERGSRGRYDKRDRGRESDDRYSKGDTRVYPDEKVLDKSPSVDEDRYRVRERYPDDIRRRGDDDKYDDRYRDYDEKTRIRDSDEARYRDRDVERPLSRSDRYKEDERYRTRDDDRLKDRDDEKYRSREDERYRPRDDDRYRLRDDDKYKSRDDDRYRLRDDERYRLRDDDKYISRDDDRYRYREDERYRTRSDDKYIISEEEKSRIRDDDRYRSNVDDRRTLPSRSRAEEDRYRSRPDDDKYTDTLTSRVRDTDIREPVLKSSSNSGERKPASSRVPYDVRIEEPITDYDTPVRDRPRLPAKDDVNPSRLSRPTYDEERYRDRDDRYRATRYDEDEIKTISPTRTRTDSTFSRSTLIDPVLKDTEDDSRYVRDSRDRIRNDRFYGENRRDPPVKLSDSGRAIGTSENSRKYIDENDRYRTRLPSEKTESSILSGKREEVVLDRRSYASEEEDDYRRGTSRTRDYYEDRSRIPSEDTRRRYRDDESYIRRDSPVEDELKRDRPRDDISRDRSKSRDRYDDEYRRYDDKYISRDEDRYSLREDRLPSSARKYDSYPDDDERSRRRDSDIRTVRIDDSRNRDEIIRTSESSRNEERFNSRDDFPESKSSSRRRYDDDDLPRADDYDAKDRDADTRRYSSASRRPVISREPVLGSSMSSMSSREPTDVVTREKRYQSSPVISNERAYMDPESDSKEEIRPLSAKDVIEAAIRHSDNSDQNSRKVHYPVFDPRVSNLTSPDIIRPSERRGTTITTRKRRSA